MKTMNYFQMKQMFASWLRESMNCASIETDEVIRYYGDSKECTLDSYCLACMDEDGIYQSVDPRGELLIPSSQFELAREAFKEAVESEYTDWLEMKISEIKEICSLPDNSGLDKGQY